MKGYSWSREDFLELLYTKYRSMKEAIYILGNDCSKCHLIKPHVVARATKNWIQLHEVLFDDDSVKEFKIESVPMLVLRENWEVTDILDEQWIINLVYLDLNKK